MESLADIGHKTPYVGALKHDDLIVVPRQRGAMTFGHPSSRARPISTSSVRRASDSCSVVVTPLGRRRATMPASSASSAQLIGVAYQAATALFPDRRGTVPARDVRGDGRCSPVRHPVSV